MITIGDITIVNEDTMIMTGGNMGSIGNLTVIVRSAATAIVTMKIKIAGIGTTMIGEIGIAEMMIAETEKKGVNAGNASCLAS